MTLAQSEKKVLLGIGVASAVLLAAGGFGIHYSLGRVSEEERVIAEVQEKIKVAQGKIKQIPGDEKDVIILRENVQEYTRVLPDEREVTEYARALTGYCSQAGMLLNTLTPATPAGGPAKSGFQNIRFKLKTQGSLWQLLHLVNLLENHPRFMQVKSLQLRGGKKDEASPDAFHTVDLEVETYWYSQAPKGSKWVAIPNYPAKRADLEEAIHGARSRFEETPYAYKGPSGRRDVFVDPRLPSVGGDAKGRLPRKQQQEIFDACRRLLAEIVEIQQMVEPKGQGPRLNIIQRFELGKELDGRISLLKTRLDRVEQEGLLSYAPLHGQLLRQVKEPLDKIIGSRSPEQAKEDYLAVEALEKVQSSMEEALELGDLELAMERFKLVQARLGPDNYGSPRRQALALALKTLNRKAVVAQEFSRKKLAITGSILQPGTLSLIVINGKPYYEGDPLEEDLFIREIGRDTVEFIYKGVGLRKRF